MAQKTTVTTKSVIDTTSAAAIASNDMTVVTKVIVSKETETAEGTIQSNFIAKTTSVESVVQGAGGQTSSQANQTVQVVEAGTAASAGKFNYSPPSSASYASNIFINLRRHTFAGNNLIFRLKTSDISTAVGTDSSTWTDNSGASSMVLTSNTATNDLKVVSSNGLKFYKLAQAKKIKQAFAITPVKSPSYTILVFALAKDGAVNATTFSDMLIQVNAVHKFIEASSVSQGWVDSGFNTKFYNFSVPSYTFRNTSNRDTNVIKSVFAGSYLNNPSFLARSSNEANSFNISESTFITDFDAWTKESKARKFSNGSNPNQVTTVFTPDALGSPFRNTKLFNLGSTSNSLAAATTPTPVSVYDGTDTITYDAFSMFFVEMFAYFNGKVGSYQNKPFEELVFETRVNGQLTFSSILPFNPLSDLSAKKTYNIALGNEGYSSNTAAIPMYLFDYLHGSAFDEPSMRKTSKQIIESLAYTYRNLFIKSSSDLQITNSSNAILFPLNISHPFMNVYAKGT